MGVVGANKAQVLLYALKNSSKKKKEKKQKKNHAKLKLWSTLHSSNLYKWFMVQSPSTSKTY